MLERMNGPKRTMYESSSDEDEADDEAEGEEGEAKDEADEQWEEAERASMHAFSKRAKMNRVLQ